jgi:hypothetical protein
MVLFEENVGFEPTGRFHDHGLANRSNNHSGNSPFVLALPPRFELGITD